MNKKPIIHPSAIVDPKATLGEGVVIGPYCTLGPYVVLDKGVHLISHVCVDGRTFIGEGTVVYPFAALGLKPQDLKFKGEPSTLTIGSHNQIREYVTMQPGTEGGGLKTVIGDRGLFMAQSHIAHDCIVGNDVIMANGATLAGHIIVEDQAFIGGLSAIHQFVRIGKGAIIGGMSAVEHDVIPFGNVKEERAFLSGLNVVGLKRRGAGREDIRILYEIYRRLFSTRATLAERVEALLKEFGHHPQAKILLDFITADSSRSLLMPHEEERELLGGGA